MSATIRAGRKKNNPKSQKPPELYPFFPAMFAGMSASTATMAMAMRAAPASAEL
jgi:hypothetical protein